MDIFIEKENKHVTKEFSGTVKDLLVSLDINPESVLIARNDTLITPDVTVTNEDKISLLSVISGG